jgi:predicted RNase H-like nuclease (RuvC/YqgF family)
MNNNNKIDEAFKRLELAILNKINQIKQDSSCELKSDDNEMLSNLNNEVNSLQNSLSEIGIENEALSKENQSLKDRLKDLESQSAKIIDQVKVDLSSIKDIINN